MFFFQETSVKILDEIIVKDVRVMLREKSNFETEIIEKCNSPTNSENKMQFIIEDDSVIEQLKMQITELLSNSVAQFEIKSNKKINLLDPNYNKIHVLIVTDPKREDVIEELLLLEDHGYEKKEKYEKLIDLLTFAEKTKKKLYIEIDEFYPSQQKIVDSCELEKKYVEIKETISKYGGSSFTYDYESSCDEQKITFSQIKGEKKHRTLKIKVEQNFVNGLFKHLNRNFHLRKDQLSLEGKEVNKKFFDVSSTKNAKLTHLCRIEYFSKFERKIVVEKSDKYALKNKHN